MKITREKVALVMFAILMLASAAFVCSYFFMGKQLNTTATVVDDATGNMQDYDLVVFSGVGEDASNNIGSSAKNSSGQDVYASGLGHDSAALMKASLVDAYSRANVKSHVWKDHVFASDVRDSYELKGAKAITIDISNLDKYAEPLIADTGRRKFGIFAVKAYMSKAKLATLSETLRSQGAESIICVTQSTSMLASMNGIDSVISLTDDFPDDQSPYLGNTLLVEAPSKGDVGVLLFSKSNVSSFKRVDTI